MPFSYIQLPKIFTFVYSTVAFCLFLIAANLIFVAISGKPLSTFRDIVGGLVLIIFAFFVIMYGRKR